MLGTEAVHRKAIILVLIAVFLFVTSCIVIWWLEVRNMNPGEAGVAKEISEITVSLGFSEETLEMRITDRSLIHKLLEKPLSNAVADVKPARYQVVGTLRIEYKDGSTDALSLFIPWGHYKHNDQYMIADFSALTKEFRELIDQHRKFLDR
jgi:hypothetical protein